MQMIKMFLALATFGLILLSDHSAAAGLEERRAHMGGGLAYAWIEPVR
jgi:hypothetical protein